MGKLIQVPVMGGLRKKVFIPDAATAAVGTTLAGFANQTITVQQLKTLLGVASPSPSLPGAGGGGSIIVGPGLGGGGAVIGAVPLYITAPIPYGLSDGGDGDDGQPGPPGQSVQGPQGITGGGGPMGPAVFLEAEAGQDGEMTVPGGQGLQGNPGSSGLPGIPVFMISDDGVDGDPGPPGAAGASGTGGTTGVNVTPDTHPTSPTVFDDEFEGSSISGAWTQNTSSGATATYGLGGGSYAQTSAGSGSTILTQAIPAGAWAFTAKVAVGVIINIASFSIGVLNSATGKSTILGRYSGDGDVYQQRGTFNTSTWVYTFSSNVTHAFASLLGGFSRYVYLKFSYDGTSVMTLSVSTTGVPGTFIPLATETIATWIVTPTHIYLGVGIIGGGSQGSSVDWFRRTA